MGESAARTPGSAAGRPHTAGASPSGPLRWGLRLLVAGPGQARPPMARLAVPYARSSMVVELVGAAVPLLAALILAVAARGGAEPDR